MDSQRLAEDDLLALKVCTQYLEHQARLEPSAESWMPNPVFLSPLVRGYQTVSVLGVFWMEFHGQMDAFDLARSFWSFLVCYPKHETGVLRMVNRQHGHQYVMWALLVERRHQSCDHGEAWQEPERSLQF